MGRRGPKPKSAANKALRGNPGKRELVDVPAEVDVSASGLNCPRRFTEMERQVWKDLMDAFPSWYFRKADLHTLILYCQSMADVQRCRLKMKNQSFVIQRANGSKCLNPLVSAMNEAQRNVVQLSHVLGISRDRRKGVLDPTLDDTVPIDPDGTENPVGEDPDDIGNLIAPAVFAQKR